MTPWPEGVSYPSPVVGLALGDDDMEAELDDTRARRDDAYWAVIVRSRFTWQRFTNWWIARRWVMPRDVKRQ